MSDRNRRDYNYNRGNQGYNRNNPNYQRDRNRGGDYRRGGGNRGYKGPREFSLPPGTTIYVLDILAHGHIDQNKRGGRENPIIQSIEMPGFNLFEMYYNKSIDLKVQEKVVLNRDPSGKVGKVKKRLKYHGLTQTSKELLQNTIEQHIEENEEIYISFLNRAGPITKKRHTLNLLPGIGQKSMWEILDARKKKDFESFTDFQERINSVKSIKNLIAKRILNEIIDDEAKHTVFVKRKRKPRPQGRGPSDRRDNYRGGDQRKYRPERRY
ncbi:MAG: DUF655 domain-containing protein [archaeon]|nr:DUF655 domain-containing protein [archaeon]